MMTRILIYFNLQYTMVSNLLSPYTRLVLVTVLLTQPRSALSSLLIVENNEKYRDHPLVVRCMKGVFELKPSLPKYNEIWDVCVVLDFF